MFKNDNELYMVIGSNIKKYRENASLTQTQLADKSGVSLSLITKLESTKCQKSISISTLNSISKVLNTELFLFLQLDNLEK